MSSTGYALIHWCKLHSRSPAKFRLEALPAESLEPIIVPMVRIQLADFPNLQCSIGQKMISCETCCEYEYRNFSEVGER